MYQSFILRIATREMRNRGKPRLESG